MSALCQKRTSANFIQSPDRQWRADYPIDGIFLGGEFSEVVDGAIPPHYLHAPNVALSHRQ
jgi:hypothetical protein